MIHVPKWHILGRLVRNAFTVSGRWWNLEIFIVVAVVFYPRYLIFLNKKFSVFVEVGHTYRKGHTSYAQKGWVIANWPHPCHQHTDQERMFPAPRSPSVESHRTYCIESGFLHFTLCFVQFFHVVATELQYINCLKSYHVNTCLF